MATCLNKPQKIATFLWIHPPSNSHCAHSDFFPFVTLLKMKKKSQFRFEYQGQQVRMPKYHTKYKQSTSVKRATVSNTIFFWRLSDRKILRDYKRDNGDNDRTKWQKEEKTVLDEIRTKLARQWESCANGIVMIQFWIQTKNFLKEKCCFFWGENCLWKIVTSLLRSSGRKLKFLSISILKSLFFRFAMAMVVLTLPKLTTKFCAPCDRDNDQI